MFMPQDLVSRFVTEGLPHLPVIFRHEQDSQQYNTGT